MAGVRLLITWAMEFSCRNLNAIMAGDGTAGALTTSLETQAFVSATLSYPTELGDDRYALKIRQLDLTTAKITQTMQSFQVQENKIIIQERLGHECMSKSQFFRFSFSLFGFNRTWDQHTINRGTTKIISTAL